MGIFSVKPKKSKEELQKEREEKIAKTSNALKLQIVALEKKKNVFLKKVIEAKQKGLKEQEIQARNLLKQAMAAEKREQGMLMTLELAVESRDLAQLNMNFLESIGSLSEDILSSTKQTSNVKAKKVEDAYLKAIYESTKQKDKIDDMLSIGEYANVVNQTENTYSEYDSEIDNMIDEATIYEKATSDAQKF